MADHPIEVSPEQAAALRESEDAVLVDVREDVEYEAGRIAGSQHIALGQVAERAGEIPRDRVVVFYCRVGSRSALAADAFRSGGYDARNLAGGLVAWVEAGLPIDPEDGEVKP
jgi:rhodanese-related sulfurtransferase